MNPSRLFTVEILRVARAGSIPAVLVVLYLAIGSASAVAGVDCDKKPNHPQCQNNPPPPPGARVEFDALLAGTPPSDDVPFPICEPSPAYPVLSGDHQTAFDGAVTQFGNPMPVTAGQNQLFGYGGGLIDDTSNSGSFWVYLANNTATGSGAINRILLPGAPASKRSKTLSCSDGGETRTKHASFQMFLGHGAADCNADVEACIVDYILWLDYENSKTGHATQLTCPAPVCPLPIATDAVGDVTVLPIEAVSLVNQQGKNAPVGELSFGSLYLMVR